MDTLIPAFLRRQRNQRRLTLEMLSAKVGMSPQHLSEIESGKRDPRLSSIERMAEAMGMTVLIVPDAMAPDHVPNFTSSWLLPKHRARKFVRSCMSLSISDTSTSLSSTASALKPRSFHG